MDIRKSLAFGYHNGLQKFVMDPDPLLQQCSARMELPPIYPEWLGGQAFNKVHGTRFAYVGGAMARGIASSRMVIELGKVGAMGFFGSAGLRPDRIEQEIRTIQAALPANAVWGSNLIHSHGDPALEETLVDLYLQYQVRRVSAAAFIKLSPAIIRYAVKGLHLDPQGNIKRTNFVFAKISRPEVARQFLSPAPLAVLNQLLAAGKITAQEAQLAQKVPLCEDVDVEGDSGGHTDSRPITALFPSIVHLRDALSKQFQYTTPIRLGVAGGVGTPDSAAAAFAMGASHIVVASVHQACVESGTSDLVRDMLARADIADFITTPSADMFELGSKVQVLKKGTLMGVRGNQLMDLFKRFDRLEDIPVQVAAELEKSVFRKSFAEIWSETESYFSKVDPQQNVRAQNDPKHKMALVFRWYLGFSSSWPIQGLAERSNDFQIWSGPAMGSFNSWVKGSFLEKPENRTVAQVALNLLEGAAVHTRMQQIRSCGLDLDLASYSYQPECLSL